MQEDLMLGPSMVTHTDLSGWSFGSNFSTTGLLSGLPDNNVITGLESWVPSTPNLISLSGMLMGCDATLSDSINGWDTSNVLDFSNAFQGYMRGRDLPDVSNWKYGSATDISGMFRDCGVVTWDLGHMDVSNVVEMGYFLGSNSVGLIEQDFSCWDVEKISEEPRGWWGLEDLVVMPLWGIAMSDLENRSHVSCRLPEGTPVPPVTVTRPLTFKVGTKEGVDTELTTALEITGSGKTTVKWGDGNHTNITGTGIVEHTYSDLTVKDLEVHGSEITRVELKESKCQVTEINSFGMIGLESLELSPGTVNVTYTVIPTSSPDTIKDLSGFCRGMSGLTRTQFKNWTLDYVVNLNNFLKNITNFDILLDNRSFAIGSADGFLEGASDGELDISGMKFNALKSVDRMFAGTTNVSINLGAVTMTAATSITNFFADSTSATVVAAGLSLKSKVVVQDWVKDSVDSTFNFSVTTVGTSSKLLGTFNFYAGTGNTLKVDRFTTNSGTSNTALFGGDSSNTIIGNYMSFKSGSNLTRAAQNCKCTMDFSNLTIGNGVIMNEFFGGTGGGGKITANDWKMGSEVIINDMFLDMEADEHVLDINNWTLTSYANVDHIYKGRKLLAGISNRTVNANNWVIPTGFRLDKTLSSVINCNVNLTGWALGPNVETESFTNGSDNLVLDVTDWTFDTGVKLITLFAFSKNATITGLASWDTSNVVSLMGLFNATLITSDISGISGWNTANVTDLGFLFGSYKYSSVTIPNLSNWNTGNVTTLRSTFETTASLNWDLGKWDVSKVTTMEYTFRYTDLTYSQDLTCWNVEHLSSQNGWWDFRDRGDNKEPLWGQANTDLTGRTHATCALPPS